MFFKKASSPSINDISDTIEEFIFSSVMYIVIAGLGIVGAERWAPNKTKSSDSIDEEGEEV